MKLMLKRWSANHNQNYAKSFIAKSLLVLVTPTPGSQLIHPQHIMHVTQWPSMNTIYACVLKKITQFHFSTPATPVVNRCHPLALLWPWGWLVDHSRIATGTCCRQGRGNQVQPSAVHPVALSPTWWVFARCYDRAHRWRWGRLVLTGIFCRRRSDSLVRGLEGSGSPPAGDGGMGLVNNDSDIVDHQGWVQKLSRMKVDEKSLILIWNII